MKRLLLLSLLTISFNASAITTIGCLIMPSIKIIAAATVASQYVWGQTKAALIEAYKQKQVEDTKGK